MKNEALLPCPFCGVVPREGVEVGTDCYGDGEFSIVCGNANCAVSPQAIDSNRYGVIKLWNTRVTFGL